MERRVWPPGLGTKHWPEQRKNTGIANFDMKDYVKTKHRHSWLLIIHNLCALWRLQNSNFSHFILFRIDSILSTGGQLCVYTFTTTVDSSFTTCKYTSRAWALWMLGCHWEHLFACAECTGRYIGICRACLFASAWVRAHAIGISRMSRSKPVGTSGTIWRLSPLAWRQFLL